MLTSGTRTPDPGSQRIDRRGAPRPLPTRPLRGRAPGAAEGPGGSRWALVVVGLMAGGACSYDPVMVGPREPPSIAAPGPGGPAPAGPPPTDGPIAVDAPGPLPDASPSPLPDASLSPPADASPSPPRDAAPSPPRDAAPSPPRDTSPPLPPDARPPVPPDTRPPDPPPPPMCLAEPEVCDGRDNDCDGTQDEGFRVSSNPSSYTVLQRFDAGCTSAIRVGIACNRATHRFCVGRGCSNTGFGPIENTGDTAVVGCLAGATLRNVTPAQLTALQEPCLPGDLFGRACSSAIHRYCRGQGFATGLGPVEAAPASALVACLAGAHVSLVDTTYSTLRGLHPNCSGNGESERFGSGCNAAISRFCVGRGALAGFGPVENSGDLATVVCIDP
jgi:hypothetical protein